MTSKLFSKRVLYLTSGWLSVYHWRERELVDARAFAYDDAGLIEFSQYLADEPAVPVYFLVDIVEEEFREETIPHVFGSDRRALIRTKQQRLFRDAHYAHAILQGRESEGRRDDRVLFTALIRPDLLSPWLAQITRHRVPLAGIYSAPILSAALLKRIPVTSDHALLVTLQSSGALRQTFFHRGRLKISRLAVLGLGEDGRYAPHLLMEVEKIRRYLNSLRLLPRDNPLDVFVLSRGPILDELREHAADNSIVRHHLFDTAEVAAKIGLTPPPDSPYADILLARLLAAETPRSHYGSREERRYYRVHRLRLGMLAASVFLAFGSLAWSGFTAVKGALAGQEQALVKRQIAFYGERYRLAQQRLPPAPAKGRELKKAVEAVRTLTRFKTSPMPTFVVLSHALDKAPDLEIDRIEWAASTDPDTPLAKSRQSGSAPYRANVQGTQARSGVALYHVARVAGRVVPFDGNYRNALETVNRFADRLSKIEDVEDVDVVELPLDVSSEQRLHGRVGVEAARQQAPFELRIVLKVRDAYPG